MDMIGFMKWMDFDSGEGEDQRTVRRRSDCGSLADNYGWVAGHACTRVDDGPRPPFVSPLLCASLACFSWGVAILARGLALRLFGISGGGLSARG